MRDRRGYGNQAYPSQTEDTDMTPSKGGYTPAIDDGGSIGVAPTPISSTPEKTPEPIPEPTEVMDTATPSAPSAATSAAEMMPDMAGEEQGGSPSYGPSSGPGQGAPAGDTAVAPVTEAPAQEASAGGPAAMASAPMASGGGTSSNSYAGDDMGWDAVAFAEAGGYDAVLMGSLPPGMCDGDGGDVFIFVDELNLEVNNNTAVQNTDITIFADDGGVIQIDEFTAITTQESVISTGADSAPPVADEAAYMPIEAPFIEGEMAMA